MNYIEIFNQVSEEIEEEKEIRRVLEYACEKEELKNVEFNVILVDNNYIHELNKNYRNIDRETDVITFALEDDHTVQNASDCRVLGDVYISVDKARSQAEEYGHSFLREIVFLAVHGFYHLLGYDHMTEAEEKIMFGKQEEVLSACEIKR